VYRFLLSRQWVILTLVALGLIPTMVWLGFWQLHRHEQRVERNDLIAGSLDSPKVAMTELTEVGGEPDPDDRYRPVTATGEYRVADQVLARQRANDAGAVGYYVLTPLIQEDGTGVLVNRGWVPAGNDPTRAPAVAAPPAGEVTVTGRLMVDETSGTTGIRDRSGLPEGMVMLINAERLGAEFGTPMLGGYVELTDTAPAAAEGGGGGGSRPEPLPEPDHTSIGAHFAYAIQWWLFAAGVPVGWVLLLRRELHDRRTQREPATGGAPGTGDAGDGGAGGPGSAGDPRSGAPSPRGSAEGDPTGAAPEAAPDPAAARL
jgi:cytochrome oxidase assembly protein ShyY1